MTASASPDDYVPDGPVGTAPYKGFCPPEIRREACAAVLEGVHMGAYDERMIEWLIGWDDPTCRTIASLMWRCRLAGAAGLAARLAVICGPAPEPASVILSPDEAEIARQALTEASAWRAWRAEGAACGECARLDPGRCPGHARDGETVARYDGLLERIGSESAGQP
jgi:hypothetical protein